MEKTKINVNNLRLAELRYYDKEKKATEIPEKKGYVFLFEKDGSFMNVFSPEEELPVYNRVPYSNTSLDGEDYGTKIILASGVEKNGLCYVIEPEKMSYVFGRESLSMKELEDYVLRSNLFFIDRIKLWKKKKVFFNRKMREDIKRMNELEDYFANQGAEVQYRK